MKLTTKGTVLRNIISAIEINLSPKPRTSKTSLELLSLWKSIKSPITCLKPPSLILRFINIIICLLTISTNFIKVRKKFYIV